MDDITNKKRGVKVSINPETSPIFYTDNVSMNANEDGIVLNVIQKVGKQGQAHVISRIGMSRTHAKKLVEKLGKLLLVTEPSSSTGKKLKN